MNVGTGFNGIQGFPQCTVSLAAIMLSALNSVSLAIFSRNIKLPSNSFTFLVYLFLYLLIQKHGGPLMDYPWTTSANRPPVLASFLRETMGVDSDNIGFLRAG